MTTEDSIREINDSGYCVLKSHLPRGPIERCRDAFWPVLHRYLEAAREPNRGPNRHFLPMPFDPPCFAPEFFFDPEILTIVRGLMGERVVADQWGCDVALRGSVYQDVHVDYQHALFEEVPDLALPTYMLVVSFGLVAIASENGAIEVAPGTHRMPRAEALQATRSGEIALRAVPLDVGDVLIRHPWTLHRGTPNRTDTPRPLVTVRYVRRWYSDDSREVKSIGAAAWRELTSAQRQLMRFPIED